MEWAIEVCKNTGKTVAASMCIGPEGDLHGVSAEECAVRMAKAGARVGMYRFNVNVFSDAKYKNRSIKCSIYLTTSFQF